MVLPSHPDELSDVLHPTPANHGRAGRLETQNHHIGTIKPSRTWFVELSWAHVPSAAPRVPEKKAPIPEGTSGSPPAPSTPQQDLMHPRFCWLGSAGTKAVLSTAVLHGHCPPRGNGNHSRALQQHYTQRSQHLWLHRTCSEGLSQPEGQIYQKRIQTEKQPRGCLHTFCQEMLWPPAREGRGLVSSSLLSFS